MPIARANSRQEAVRRHQDLEFERLKRAAETFNDAGATKLPISGGGGVVSRSEDGAYQVKDTETHVIKIQATEDKSAWVRVKQLAAGGGAGAITKTAVAPLERVKILLQVQGMKMQDGTTKAQFKYQGVTGTLRTMVKEEGMLALYKGNGANVLRVVPVYALKFTFNDTFKDVVRTPGQPLDFKQLIAAGTMAGLFQTCVTYPLETVRTRLTLGMGLGVKYDGIFDVVRKTVKAEGVRGLYKGIGPTFLSGSPYVGLQMTFYELFKRRLEARADEQSVARNQLDKLLSGAAAGVIAQTVTYPGDTVRRRMQMNGMGGEAKMYTNSWDCAVKLVKREGPGGLFNGLKANLIRCLPGAAIQFYAYDTLCAQLEKI